ncbi:MAG: ArnT family glycosyltransferase [Anaerolineae bacterium]
MDVKVYIARLLDTPRSGNSATGARFWTRIAPRIILAVFALLCLVTSVVNPLGEGYDEWAHFAYIRYIVTERQLPESGQRLVPEIGWDATHHPPLYYLIGAAATSWVDMSDNLRPITNPHMSSGRSLNAYVHTAAENWPYRGSALGMHVARGVSTLMGLLTLWLTYRIATILAPQRPALAVAAMAITAFMPQFVFTHSIITNDAAVTMFSALTLYCMVQLFARLTPWAWLGMWLAIAAAFMSKANGVALIPASVMVSGWALWRVRGRLSRWEAIRVIAFSIVSIAAILLLLFGWEQWNAYLSGHHSSVTGALGRYVMPLLGGRGTGASALYDWSILPAGLAYMWRTFWAAFGLGNVPADEVFYWIVSAFALAGAAGAIRAWRLLRRPERWRAAVPALVALMLLVPPVFLIPVSRLSFVSPGRYLMPLAPILGMALAVGLARVLPGTARPALSWVFAGLLLFVSIIAPWHYIHPAYAAPRLLTAEQVRELATPATGRFGERMELLGYRVADHRLRPGDTVDVTLYWRCLAEMQQDFTVAVQAVDPDLRFYGGIVNYPGRGSYPTSLWQPGQIIEDRHRFVLGKDIPVPAFVQIKVDVYILDTGEFLPVQPAESHGQTAVVFGRVPVSSRPHTRLWPSPSIMASFGNAIELVGTRLPETMPAGETIEVALTWRCSAPPAEDYTVFIHLLDSAGTIIAQADGPPVNGRYPTSLWSRGEQIEDSHRLTLPAGAGSGRYYLAVGWYAMETGERLQAVDSNGVELDLSEVLIPVQIPAQEPSP